MNILFNSSSWWIQYAEVGQRIWKPSSHGRTYQKWGKMANDNDIWVQWYFEEAEWNEEILSKNLDTNSRVSNKRRHQVSVEPGKNWLKQ